MKIKLRRVEIPKVVFVFCCVYLLKCVVAGRDDDGEPKGNVRRPALWTEKPIEGDKMPRKLLHERAWRGEEPARRGEKTRKRDKEPTSRIGHPAWLGEKTKSRDKKPEWRREDPTWRGEESSWRGEDPTWRSEEPAWRGEKPLRHDEEPVWHGGEPKWRGEKPVTHEKVSKWRGNKPKWRGEEPEWNGEEPEGAGEEAGWLEEEPEWRDEETEFNDEESEWSDEEGKWRDEEPEWRDEEPEPHEEKPKWHDAESMWRDKQSRVDKEGSSWGGARLTDSNRDSAVNDTLRGHTLKCVDGLVLKVWRPLEDVSSVERGIRGTLYFLAMCYLFLGVSIVADRFMEAIEVITSSERRVSVINAAGQRETISVRVWNETVANLTLMALGSSAPEILLSIIEMFQKNFMAGDLGPGTIVGSAAYNLFIIIALCMVVVPAGQVRRILHLRVYIVTAAWSIFAYIWMYLILAVISPNIVEVWEGLVTFILFPVTVLHAYIAETRKLCYKTKESHSTNKNGIVVSKQPNVEEGGGEDEAQAEGSDADDENKTRDSRESVKQMTEADEMREFEELRREYLAKLKELYHKYPQYDLDKLQAMAQEQLIMKSPKSRAFYRIQATRRMVGSGNLIGKAREQAHGHIVDVKAEMNRFDPLDYDEDDVEEDEDAEVHLYFSPAHYTVMESVGDFPLFVRRSGDLSEETTVEYYTEDGTAVAGADYVASSGVVTFAPGVEEQQFRISIVDDEEFEQEEYFTVRLRKPSGLAVLKTPKIATVMILDDDHCGIFGFETDKDTFSEDIGTFELKVRRYYGVRSKVIVPFRMMDGTATSGKEYTAVNGTLTFLPGDIEQKINIKIIHEHSFQKNVNFSVRIGTPFIAPGDPLAEELSAIHKIPEPYLTPAQKLLLLAQPTLSETIKIKLTITESEEFKHTVNKLVQTANASRLIGTSSWKEQFIDALTVTGGRSLSFDDGDEDNDDGEGEDNEEAEEDEGEEEEEGEPGCLEYSMHFLSLFWKIVFAAIPPSKLYDGYVCFFVSIFFIAIATAVLGDVAMHFGCTLGVLDSVTAICFVALGTSIPDTFASKVAAIHDKTADNSVGNVTGSNAVNVFLGIGIAWSMASIYHAFRGEVFNVPIGSLAFSTTLFLIEAFFALALIGYRRKQSIGGELGGPVRSKWIHSMIMVLLWLIYLALSTLEAYKIISF